MGIQQFSAPPPSVAMTLGCPPITFCQLPPDAPFVLQGLSPQAPCIAFGGKQFKDFFSNAHSILSELVQPNEVKFEDDPDWKRFPHVAAAIRQGGGEENCYMVATAESHGVWA